jgi:hypothetical protein
MLVTFHSKAWNSITMFGDFAVTLLKMTVRFVARASSSAFGRVHALGTPSQSDSLHLVTRITQIHISFTNLARSEFPWLQRTRNRL